MILRLAGAVMRAFFVVLLVATPSLLLPEVSRDSTQIVALIALFAAALTIFEYASAYPGLIEFRDAPPFNRLRFVSLFACVFLLTVMFRGASDPSILLRLLAAVGGLVGQVMDFPYSPVRLMVLMLPADTDPAKLQMMRTLAGLSYLISIVSLACFGLVLRLRRWPGRARSFNVWVNLPTFDPTAGGDVVTRLQRDARFNIALGFLLPFVMPALLRAAAALFGAVTLDSPQTLIWTVTAWAFLPASLFMRGIAMARVAELIEDKRRQSYAAEEEEREELQPV